MTKNIRVALAACILTAVLGLVPLLSADINSYAADGDNTGSASLNAALSLDVTWDKAVCGEPVTFTLTASSGYTNYKYYLNSVELKYNDNPVPYYVVDPSKLEGYTVSNTKQFTFYASGTYTLKFYTMAQNSSGQYTTARKNVTFTVNDPDYPSADAVADRVAKECLDAGCTTDYEKAIYLHDWLVDNCKYDYSYFYCGPEGALCRGTGTCEAYHRAYEMLLKRVGVETARIEGSGHVWTGVKMDGKWYEVDVTWDDNGYSYRTYENYIYFGLNHELMNLVHTGTTPVECTDLANHYFIKSGMITNWINKYNSSILSNLKAGKTSFTLAVDSTLPEQYRNVIFGVGAYWMEQRFWICEGKAYDLSVKYSAADNKYTVNAWLVNPAMLSMPAKEGYTFAGWSKDSSSATPEYTLKSSFILEKTAVLYPIYKMMNKATLKFSSSPYSGITGNAVAAKYRNGALVEYKMLTALDLSSGLTNKTFTFYEADDENCSYKVFLVTASGWVPLEQPSVKITR